MPGRTRVRNDIISQTLSTTTSGTFNNETLHTCSASAPETVTAPFPYPIGTYEAMTDFVTPGYSQRSARGEIFVNPMSKIKFTRKISLSTKSYHVPYPTSYPSAHRHCTYYRSQDMPNSPQPLEAHASTGPVMHLESSSVSVAQLSTLAGTQAAAAVDAPTFDGATFVSELRETIGFLKNPFTSLNRGLIKVRDKKNRNIRYYNYSVAEFLSANWLSYRYAIKPLIMDAHDAVKAVNEVVDGHKPIRKTARGKASASDHLLYSWPRVGTWTHDTTTELNVDVRAGILYEYLRSPDTFGTNLRDIPSAVWEAMTASFLIDWAFNVGSFIEAISPVGGIKRLASWTTVQTTQRTTRETWWFDGGVHSSGEPRIIEQDGRCREEFTSEGKTRSLGISVGLSPTSSAIDLATDLGKARALDLVALTSQILRSRR